MIRLWLLGMKWIFVLFLPIACLILLVLPIWTSVWPWVEAKEQLKEVYPSNVAIQIAGGSSSYRTSEEYTKSRSATYVLFPHVLSSFTAVTVYKVESNDEVEHGIKESAWVLIFMLSLNTALVIGSVFWSWPKIKGLLSW